VGAGQPRTRQAASALPEPATTAFWLLCCLEESDRHGQILTAIWPALWGENSQPPDLGSALAPLVARALVDTEEPEEPLNRRRYRIHPAVAETGRAAAGPEFRTDVDKMLPFYWRMIFETALEREGQDQVSGTVVHAGRAAVPYLLRLGFPSAAGSLLEQVLVRDSSPVSMAAAVPLLRRIAAATVGTEHELACQAALGRALIDLGPAEAERLLRDALARAEAVGDVDLTSAVISHLVSLLHRQGHMGEALALIENEKAHSPRAGPWTRLAEEVLRLRLLADTGHHIDVLNQLRPLWRQMHELLDNDARDEHNNPWNVCEFLLDTGRVAALGLEQWQLALEFNAQMLLSQHCRGAGELQLAATRFNNYGPFLYLGELREARAVLLGCRDIFEQAGDVRYLALLFSALGEVEAHLAHYADALTFEQRALRYFYLEGHVEDIARSHSNLANYLGLPRHDPGAALAHRLAAAFIRYHTDSGLFRDTVNVLASQLDQMGETVAAPASVDELCAQVERVEGVCFRHLIEELPARSPTLDHSLAEVLALARRPWEQRLLEGYQPLIAEVLAAAGGAEPALAKLTPLLEALSAQHERAALAETLRRLLAGDRNRETLIADLDAMDTVLVSHILSQLEDP
jgi:hypothetical protein